MPNTIPQRDDAIEAAYQALLQRAAISEQEALALGLQLVALAPPQDTLRLLEIMADENEHTGIYRQLIAENTGYTPDEIDAAFAARKAAGL